MRIRRADAMLPPNVKPPAPSPVPPDFLDRCETLTGAIVELAERFPAYECLIVLDRNAREERTSLGRFWERAKAAQALFTARGLAPGDHALLILPTGSDLVSTYFGVMLAGVALRHCNSTRLVGSELAR